MRIFIPLGEFVEAVTFALVDNVSSIDSALDLPWEGLGRVVGVEHVKTASKLLSWGHEVSKVDFWVCLNELIDICDVIIV